MGFSPSIVLFELPGGLLTDDQLKRQTPNKNIDEIYKFDEMCIGTTRTSYKFIYGYFVVSKAYHIPNS